MDHHCPWLGNCVGFHNHKSFYLLCFYVSVGGIYYLGTLVYLAWICSNRQAILSGMAYGLYLFCGVLFASVVLSMMFMTLMHTLHIMENVTTIERLKGVEFYNPLWCGSSDNQSYFYNCYNLGVVYNLERVFGKYFFYFWLLPLTNYKNSGIHYLWLPNPAFYDLLPSHPLPNPNPNPNPNPSGQANPQHAALQTTVDDYLADVSTKYSLDNLDFEAIARLNPPNVPQH
jgi:hypothetical protein